MKTFLIILENMDRRCIVICDSGVGGLSLLRRLSEKMPWENFVYYADYNNLPYGEKSREKLLEIASVNYEKFMPFCPKKIIFACNTLSVNTMRFHPCAGVEIVRVLPKVKNKGKGLLLCTDATAKSEHIQELKSKNKLLDVVPMKGLAEKIEKFLASGEDIDFKELFLHFDKDYEFVSLGCTHYTIVQSEIQKVFPFSQILSGEDDVFEKIVFSVTTFDTFDHKGELSFVGEGCDSVKSLYFKRFLKI